MPGSIYLIKIIIPHVACAKMCTCAKYARSEVLTTPPSTVVHNHAPDPAPPRLNPTEATAAHCSGPSAGPARATSPRATCSRASRASRASSRASRDVDHAGGLVREAGRLGHGEAFHVANQLLELLELRAHLLELCGREVEARETEGVVA